MNLIIFLPIFKVFLPHLHSSRKSFIDFTRISCFLRLARCFSHRVAEVFTVVTMKGPDPELILIHTGRSLFGEPYPEEFRPILITSVLALASASELHKTLIENCPGFNYSQNTVDSWLIAARAWLGLGKNNKLARAELPAWLELNGRPTIEDIRNGWQPRHHRVAVSNPDLSGRTDPGPQQATSLKPTAGSGIKPVKPAPPAPQFSSPPNNRENPEGDPSVENGKTPINRSVEEIQEEIRNVPALEKNVWEEAVFLLKSELFTVTNSRPPDKGDTNDIRAGLPGMWRDARSRAKKRSK
jgi:hypothetical protein